MNKQSEQINSLRNRQKYIKLTSYQIRLMVPSNIGKELDKSSDCQIVFETCAEEKFDFNHTFTIVCNQ